MRGKKNTRADSEGFSQLDQVGAGHDRDRWAFRRDMVQGPSTLFRRVLNAEKTGRLGKLPEFAVSIPTVPGPTKPRWTGMIVDYRKDNRVE